MQNGASRNCSRTTSCYYSKWLGWVKAGGNSQWSQAEPIVFARMGTVYLGEGVMFIDRLDPREADIMLLIIHKGLLMGTRKMGPRWRGINASVVVRSGRMWTLTGQPMRWCHVIQGPFSSSCRVTLTNGMMVVLTKFWKEEAKALKTRQSVHY